MLRSIKRGLEVNNFVEFILQIDLTVVLRLVFVQEDGLVLQINIQLLGVESQKLQHLDQVGILVVLNFLDLSVGLVHVHGKMVGVDFLLFKLQNEKNKLVVDRKFIVVELVFFSKWEFY